MSKLTVDQIAKNAGTAIDIPTSGQWPAASIADDAVGTAQLSATGTASATTFLRGDNAWAEAGGGKILQVVNTSNGEVVSGTTLIPSDDTILQITEGIEMLIWGLIHRSVE